MVNKCWLAQLNIIFFVYRVTTEVHWTQISERGKLPESEEGMAASPTSIDALYQSMWG